MTKRDRIIDTFLSLRWALGELYGYSYSQSAEAGAAIIEGMEKRGFIYMKLPNDTLDRNLMLRAQTTRDDCCYGLDGIFFWNKEAAIIFALTFRE